MNYKAPDNSLHYIEPEFSNLLPAGSVHITDEEAAAIHASQIITIDPKISRLAEIDQEAQLTPRAFRELVILMTEGFRLATSGTLDLKAIVPGVAQVFALEEEAATIRNQLGSGY